MHIRNIGLFSVLTRSPQGVKEKKGEERGEKREKKRKEKEKKGEEKGEKRGKRRGKEGRKEKEGKRGERKEGEEERKREKGKKGREKRGRREGRGKETIRGTWTAKRHSISLFNYCRAAPPRVRHLVVDGALRDLTCVELSIALML
jgi:hypothetical protein